MNEEQTVLEFFSRDENLSLALIAAEHLDNIRLQHNNRFWNTLHEHLNALLTQQELPWRAELTEDRNSEGNLVGLHLEPHTQQRSFLRPFMEQQLMENSYRIYYGLMWNATTEPAQIKLPAVESLRTRMAAVGFKDSDSFLAWQWSPWFPRRKDFLLRYSNKRDELLKEVMQPWQALLQEFGNQLLMANVALKETPQSAAISLDQLHQKTKR
jgi:hypothetical protein